MFMENNIDIKQIKEEINKIKLEIIEKQDKIDELLAILNNETVVEEEFIEEN